MNTPTTTRPDVMPLVRSQFSAAMAMLDDCIDKCPDERWDMPIAKYPLWMVAYHTLCFVDCYLAPSNEAWTPHPVFHPKGWKELEDEYPSRRFTREELQAYSKLCREKLAAALGDGPQRETDAVLSGPSGFSWLPFTRLELHLYNLRHVQHHAGQLSAALRRVGVETRWVKSGPGGAIGPGPKA